MVCQRKRSQPKEGEGRLIQIEEEKMLSNVTRTHHRSEPSSSSKDLRYIYLYLVAGISTSGKVPEGSFHG